ncbi:MAG: hypothetical protein EXS16_10505 [Gemmataceae bacterium]|nr:hypothetical protein [Gemmataceae bacterium]
MFAKKILVVAIVLLGMVPKEANASYVAPSSSLQLLACGPYACYGTLPYLAYNPNGCALPGANPYSIPGCSVTGTRVGTTTQCVAFARTVTGAPATGGSGENWRRGKQVVGGNVPVGTLIATFVWNQQLGRYVYSGHTCVFRGYGSSGSLLAWSQNWPAGLGCVVAHSISGNSGGVTDPRSYYVVE